MCSTVKIPIASSMLPLVGMQPSATVPEKLIMQRPHQNRSCLERWRQGKAAFIAFLALSMPADPRSRVPLASGKFVEVSSSYHLRADLRSY